MNSGSTSSSHSSSVVGPPPPTTTTTFTTSTTLIVITDSMGDYTLKTMTTTRSNSANRLVCSEVLGNRAILGAMIRQRPPATLWWRKKKQPFSFSQKMSVFLYDNVRRSTGQQACKLLSDVLSFQNVIPSFQSWGFPMDNINLKPRHATCVTASPLQ